MKKQAILRETTTRTRGASNALHSRKVTHTQEEQQDLFRQVEQTGETKSSNVLRAPLRPTRQDGREEKAQAKMSEEKFNMFYCYETGSRTEVDFFEWRGTQEEARRAFKTSCAQYKTLLWAELKNVSRGDIIVDEVEPRKGG